MENKFKQLCVVTINRAINDFNSKWGSHDEKDWGIDGHAQNLSDEYQKLVDALWKIANGAAPYNQQQLESWRETAIEIAQETLNEITK